MGGNRARPDVGIGVTSVFTPMTGVHLRARVLQLLQQEREAQDEFDATGCAARLDAVQGELGRVLSVHAADALEFIRTNMTGSIERMDNAARERALGYAAVHIPKSGGVSRRVERRASRILHGREEDDDCSDVEDLEAWDPVRLDPKAHGPAPLQLEAHQHEGIEFLLNRVSVQKGGILAFVMGLGKTRTALVAAEKARMRKIVVVAPSSVVSGWSAEYVQLAAHLSFRCHPPLAAAADSALVVGAWNASGGLLVVSYDLLSSMSDSRRHRGAVQTLHASADVVILDELHIVKNLKTKRAKVIARFDTPHRWGLTGTPLSNHPVDFFNIVSIVDASVAENLESATFSEDFELPIERGQYYDATPAEKTMARERTAVLRHIFQPVTLHKSDLILRKLLPPKTEYVIVYAYDDDCASRLASEVNAHAGYLNAQFTVDSILRPRKVEIARTMIRAMDAGDAILVFSEHPYTLRALASHLEGRASIIDGSTATTARQGIIDSFQAGAIDILLLSLGAAAVGINCQRANRVVLLDPSENPMRDAQAVCRAWRMGQTRPVSVYRLAARDTVDVRVMRRGALKAGLAHSIVQRQRINTPITRADATSDAASGAFVLEGVGACSDTLVQSLQTLAHGWTSFDAFFADAEDDSTDHASAANNRNKSLNQRDRTFVHDDGAAYTVGSSLLWVASDAGIILAPPPLPILEYFSDGVDIELCAPSVHYPAHAAFEVAYAYVDASGRPRGWSQPERTSMRRVRRIPSECADQVHRYVVCKSRVVVDEQCGPWSKPSAMFGSHSTPS